jgi:predicted ArsR family transcriptional regulator
MSSRHPCQINAVEDALGAEPIERKEDLEREVFLLSMVNALSGTLQDVVGLKDAEGYISTVGERIGETICGAYRNSSDNGEIKLDDLSYILTDLKARIGGTFKVESEDSKTIEFSNTKCPFGSFVDGRPSLCMMTSNVFGTIAATLHGEARVELLKTIANGDGCCSVLVHTDGSAGGGRRYFAYDD